MTGTAASAVQLVITVLGLTVEALAVSSGVSVKAGIGEPERVVHSLTGEAVGFGCLPGAAEAERGIAVDR